MMDPQWFPPEDRPFRPIGRSWMAFGGVCFTSLLIPPGKLRLAMAIPALLYIASRCRMYSSGKAGEDYMLTVNVAMVGAKWVDFVLLRTPELELHRVDETKEGRPLVVEDARNMTLWQKFKWATSFWFTFRGVGWDWQVKNVPKVPLTTTRGTFLIKSLVGYLKCYLILDFLHHYTFSTPYSQLTNVPDLFGDRLTRQIVLGWVLAIQTGVGMAFSYHLCAAVAVATRMSAPQEWPSAFGSFAAKGYKMRNIWGSCWHQYLRQIFTRVTSAITRGLGVKKGTLASRYIQLYGAFVVSAAVHHIGALNVPYHPAVKSQLFFFLIQPFAITAEDFVTYIGKRYGIKESAATKALGYLWVFSFLSYSLRFMAAMSLPLGASAIRHPLLWWNVADRVL